MKKILLFTVIGCLTFTLKAQQQEHYSMYMQNNFLVNPAEGGTDEFVDIKLGYRTQWLNFGSAGNGGPNTMFLSGHTPLGKHQSSFDDVNQMAFHGVGGAIIADRIGPFNILTAKASYAYHLPVTKSLILSIGAFAGVKQFQISASELEFSSDQTATDPFAHSFQTAWVPDISLGIWGYSKSYYFGIASFQLMNSRVNIFKDIDETLTNASAGGALAMHHWATAGYKIHITDDWFVVPSLVLKFVQNTPLTFDLNAKVRYQDKYWLGMSFRKEDAMVVLAGVTIKKKIDVGYSFDATRTDIRDYSTGTHEIILGYRLPISEHEAPPSQFW